MPEFAFQELLPVGHHDDTPFKQLTSDLVSTFSARGKTFLDVQPEALTLLARTAMRDIAHLLRPGHLGQLRAILDDPEASPNDRFVALELLKNANIAAGGILPGCTDKTNKTAFGWRAVRRRVSPGGRTFGPDATNVLQLTLHAAVGRRSAAPCRRAARTHRRAPCGDATSRATPEGCA